MEKYNDKHIFVSIAIVFIFRRYCMHAFLPIACTLAWLLICLSGNLHAWLITLHTQAHWQPEFSFANPWPLLSHNNVRSAIACTPAHTFLVFLMCISTHVPSSQHVCLCAHSLILHTHPCACLCTSHQCLHRYTLKHRPLDTMHTSMYAFKCYSMCAHTFLYSNPHVQSQLHSSAHSTLLPHTYLLSRATSMHIICMCPHGRYYHTHTWLRTPLDIHNFNSFAHIHAKSKFSVVSELSWAEYYLVQACFLFSH